jgi:TonB family protein
MNALQRNAARKSLAAAIVSILLTATAPAQAPSLDDGFSQDQSLMLGRALNAARYQVQQCFTGIALPGGALLFSIKLDGAAGHMLIDSIMAPQNLDPNVEACVRAAYSRQKTPIFDGPVRTTTFSLAPPGAIVPPGPTPTSVIARPAAANSHACPLPPELMSEVQGESQVLVSLHVEADGSVSNVKAVKSSGSDNLDAAAVGCVSQWRYLPMTKDGTAITTDLRAIVVWRAR